MLRALVKAISCRLPLSLAGWSGRPDAPAWGCGPQSTLTTKRTMVLRNELVTAQEPGWEKSIPVGQNCSVSVYP
jgi:hypothetical protein